MKYSKIIFPILLFIYCNCFSQLLPEDRFVQQNRARNIDNRIDKSKIYHDINQISIFNYYYVSGYKKIDSLNDKGFALIQLNKEYEPWDKKIVFVQIHDKKYIHININIIDTLSVNLKWSDYYFDLAWGGMCYNNNKLDKDIIAFLSARVIEKSPLKTGEMKVIKAWRADRLKRKIIKIDSDKLKCECNP